MKHAIPTNFVTAYCMLTIQNVSLQVYRGVVSEYKEMVNQLMSGPCVAMEIVATDGCEDVVSSFRELAGPADPVRLRINITYLGFSYL